METKRAIVGYLLKNSNVVVTEREILKNINMGDFEEVTIIIPYSELYEMAKKAREHENELTENV